MAFQLSPGVNVSEIDLTTVVPAVLTTAGAFAGTFNWGPADKITLVDSELTLAKVFGKPDSNTAVSFFTCANFLAYGNNLSVVRAIGANSYNATGDTSVQIKNEDVYEDSYLNNDNENTYGAFASRYAGELGNSLKISVCSNTDQFDNWSWKNYFNGAPGTSQYANVVGGSDDEMHIAVIDKDGLFTGTANTVLETYSYVSKASDATLEGSTNYYKQVIFNDSQYIFAMDPVDYSNTSTSWGSTAAGTTFESVVNVDVTLTGGTNEAPSVTTEGDLYNAYDMFANKEMVDISLILTGDADTTIQNHVISGIAASRADCVAFVSPPRDAVVNQTSSAAIGKVVTDTDSWLNTLDTYSSFAMADSGWKYQFDKYNNVYRWIPLNGDIAGLCVYTDTVRDPWFSPAGLNRGQIKNCIKLAWNPSKTYRDILYKNGVNPVVSFPGQGVVLFGDKTFTNKPSAFDHINVRRLFIVLEKSIAEAAKYSLFELNDEFTRAQFVSLVTPFLRDVKGRRGIYDFKVVCDTTNNTPQVIDTNRFVGDIYIKPARSINYIQLNFVAVGTGVDFTTVVGAF